MKVTADDIGIHVSWNRPARVDYPGRRTMTGIRIAQIVLVAFYGLLIVLNALTGNLGLAVLLDTVVVVLGAAGLEFSARVTRRIKAQAIKQNRPRPDYRRIAAAETDIYGRTFEHAGAPDFTRRALDARMDGLVAECERRAAPGAFTRRGLCDSGYHVYSYSEPGCMICERKWKR